MAGRSGGMAGDLTAGAAGGAITGAGGRLSGPGGPSGPSGTEAAEGAACAAGQGPADCRTAGLSETAGGGGLTLAGATRPGSTITLFAGSSATTGLAGAWL